MKRSQSDVTIRSPTGNYLTLNSQSLTLRTDVTRDDSYRQYPMSKITESLYLGSDNDANNLEQLHAEKITHCLSMVARKWSTKTRSVSAFRRIIRKCVPMSDLGNSNVTKLLEEKDVLSFMEDSQKGKNKLLVHCQLGQNRSPTIVMAFLMKQNHWTLHQAWRKVKQKRVIIQPNKKYIRQLRDWDMYLHGKHSTPPDFLRLSVTGEDIELKFEDADTKRMVSVLAESMQKLRNSTLSFASQEEVEMDMEVCLDDLVMFSGSERARHSQASVKLESNCPLIRMEGSEFSLDGG